jgi:DNA helicase-2/ATP-dependent DNA helicase PcrA
MNEQFFNDLKLIQADDNQKQAYESQENTVVIAGPGSGKTRVLALKAVTLARVTVKKPCGIALISFSRETVRELKKRLRLYNFKPGNRDFIGTVHTFSLIHVIQPFGHLYPQYSIKYPVKILPSEVEAKLYQEVLTEMRINEKAVSMTEINKERALFKVGKSGVKIPSNDIMALAARAYEKKLFKTEYIDFPAMINLSAQMIQEQEFIRYSLKSRFPWLLIDEYQDLGKSLHEIVLELTLNAGIRLFAVGDMNQSIYGFTGGFPEYLKELTQQDDIRNISLSSNYRSNRHIIAASIEALGPAPPAPVYVAKLRDDEVPDFTFITCSDEMDAQYAVIAKKVIPNLLADDVPYNEIGIILNSNEQVKHMAIVLGRSKLPFYISKWDFENSAIVVWLQDCASWCTSQNEQSLDDLFNFFKDLLSNHRDDRRFMPSIDLKVRFHQLLRSSKKKPLVEEWLSFVISGLNLADVLKDSEMYPNEIKNLQILIDEAKFRNLKGATVARFANLGSPDNEITVTTRHSAKGLEFEMVILPGMEEGNFPNYRIVKNPVLMAEAQRVCYVCVSRAKKGCILLRSEYYINYRGERQYYNASRFWTALKNKFGNAGNEFKDSNYS